MKIYLDKVKEREKLFLDNYLSEDFGKYYVFDEPSYNKFIQSKNLKNISQESYYNFFPIGNTRAGVESMQIFTTHEYPFSDILYSKTDQIDKIFVPTTQIQEKYFNDLDKCIALANLNDLEKNKNEVNITNNQLVIIRSGINVFDNFIVNKFKVNNGTYQISHVFDKSWVQNMTDENAMIKDEQKLERSADEYWYEEAWEARRAFIEDKLEPNLHFIYIRLKEN
jgi:hypothetical protein